MIAGPVQIHSYVGHTDESPALPRDQSLHGRTCSANLHIEIEHLFPHRREIHVVPSLPEILLRDLELDRLTGFRQSSEQWRRRLAHLEIDRPVLNLDHDVVIELSIES